MSMERLSVVRSRGGIAGVVELTICCSTASWCAFGSLLYSASHFWPRLATMRIAGLS